MIFSYLTTHLQIRNVIIASPAIIDIASASKRLKCVVNNRPNHQSVANV